MDDVIEKVHDEEIVFPTTVGAKSVSCEHCSNIFNISFRRRRHCLKEFRQFSNLNNELRIHDNEMHFYVWFFEII